MGTSERRRALLDLILEVAFRRERVVLASGKESDFYLDLRQVLMRPRGVASRAPSRRASAWRWSRTR